MSIACSLRYELKDGTLEIAFASYTNKAQALRVAKSLSKNASFNAVNLIVYDIASDCTVKVFKLPE